MPLYRYKCENKKCEREMYELRGIDKRDATPECHLCGQATKRMLDVASVSFIGKGFASNE